MLTEFRPHVETGRNDDEKNPGAWHVSARGSATASETDTGNF